MPEDAMVTKNSPERLGEENSLFRTEVFEHQKLRSYGAIVQSNRPSWSFLLIAATALISIIIFFLRLNYTPSLYAVASNSSTDNTHMLVTYDTQSRLINLLEGNRVTVSSDTEPRNTNFHVKEVTHKKCNKNQICFAAILEAESSDPKFKWKLGDFLIITSKPDNVSKQLIKSF